MLTLTKEEKAKVEKELERRRTKRRETIKKQIKEDRDAYLAYEKALAESKEAEVVEEVSEPVRKKVKKEL